MLKFIFNFIIILIGGFYIYENFLYARPQDFMGISPAFHLEDYFDTSHIGYGYKQNWRGELIEKFKIKQKSIWQHDKGKVLNLFYYDNGQKIKQNWFLLKKDQHNYELKINNIDSSSKASIYGNNLQLKYKDKITVLGYQLPVNIHQRMYLLENNLLISIAKTYFFYVPIYTQTIIFYK